VPSNLQSPLIWQGISFGDSDAFSDFLGQHQFWHQALASITGTPALLFDDLRTKLLRHAENHIAIDRALGLPHAYDLVSYDLQDKDSFDGFMATHALLHNNERLAGGI
jgi:hypothetical protein